MFLEVCATSLSPMLVVRTLKNGKYPPVDYKCLHLSVANDGTQLSLIPTLLLTSEERKMMEKRWFNDYGILSTLILIYFLVADFFARIPHPLIKYTERNFSQNFLHKSKRRIETNAEKKSQKEKDDFVFCFFFKYFFYFWFVFSLFLSFFNLLDDRIFFFFNIQNGWPILLWLEHNFCWCMQLVLYCIAISYFIQISSVLFFFLCKVTRISSI